MGAVAVEAERAGVSAERAPEPLAVYVPAPGLGPLTAVARGSAIVGPVSCGPGCPRPFAVYYEGNVYGASNLATLAERAESAAGRLRNNHPTTARAVVRAHDVEKVGVLREGEDGPRIEVSDDAGVPGGDERARSLLADWLDVVEAGLDPELAPRSRAASGGAVARKGGGR